MAVIVILAVGVAAVVVAGVTLWRRSQRTASGAPTTVPVHPEFGPDGAAAAAPTAPPPRESYYAHAPPSRAKGRPMGWYSVDGVHGDERYWDGQRWTLRRQQVAGVWSSTPVGGD
jgi:uncharacterized protein DUF2510